MTLRQAIENYPIHDTLVGFYDCMFTFTCNHIDELKDMDYWTIPPFTEPQDGYFNFVRYMGDHQFECWCFAYSRIAGYLHTDNSNAVIPMTYSEDFGWEEANPDVEDEDRVIIAPDVVWEVITAERVAMRFDPESFNEGYIFLNKEELEEFVKRGEF